MNNLASFSNCENPINFIPINNLNLFDHFYLFPQFMFDKKKYQLPFFIQKTIFDHRSNKNIYNVFTRGRCLNRTTGVAAILIALC